MLASVCDQCLCMHVFRMIFTKQIDWFPKQHYPIGLSDGHRVCSLWGGNWFCTVYILQMNVSLQSVATAACFNKARPIKDTCRFLQHYTTRVIAEQLKHWGTARLHESHSERNYRLAYQQRHTVKPTRLKECNNPHSYLRLILGINI